ncbi:hypothetical protein GmHk_03G007176 [Glycine max]|nr:hypothetical protein GmHk_03G007176 [Glycine max]
MPTLRRERPLLLDLQLSMILGDSNLWKLGIDTRTTFSARISFRREMIRFIILSSMSSKWSWRGHVAVVKEFYANLYNLEDQALKQARVRGHLIKIDADSLNEFLQTPVVLKEGESLPTYSRFCRLRSNPQEIEARLYIPRNRFVLNAKGQPWKDLRKDLPTLAQTWSVFSYSNLAPTSHTSNLNMDRAKLVYGLVTHMDMNIGALILGQISSIAHSNSFRLGFPALITALCRARGVTSDSLTYESLSPTINLAYIKKNYWNMDDLTVNFRGARKARARPIDVPSSSTPPALSTSTTPTPAPPGPSA